jgi:hypothetical protein
VPYAGNAAVRRQGGACCRPGFSVFLSCSSGTIIVGTVAWIKKVLSFRIEAVEMSISTLKDLLNNQFHGDSLQVLESRELSRIENL